MVRKGLAVAVILLFIGVAFAPSINAVDDPVPDLDCEGDFYWTDVVPGATVEGSFIVENIGEPGSSLNWEIQSYPDWGNWTCVPDGGTGLLPGAPVTVDVEVIFPDPPEEEQWSEVIIVNIDNPDDYCVIDAHYPGEAVPVVKKINQKSIDTATPIALVLQLIAKLRNHKDIQNVETENDVLQIIESDEELNSIVEQLSVEDCGCEDEETTEGEYPIIICLILFVIFAVALNSSPFPVGLLVLISYGIADKLNCPFTTVR